MDSLPPFHPSRPGLVRPVPVDPSGVSGPTPKQARGPRWRRTSRGLYVPSRVTTDDVDQRIAETAPLLGEHESVAGWAALRWLGGGWFTGRDPRGDPLPVLLSVRSHRTPQPGLVISQESVRPGHRTERDGLPVTSAVWAVCFEARYAASWARAVEVIDMAAYSDLVSLADVAECASHLPGWTGIQQLRTALAHADENSWSPQETAMRLAWTTLGGFPRPLANRPVFDRYGRHLGTPDLIDVQHGVVGEYDGALHLAGDRRWRDVEREARFREAGLECVTMLAGDLGDRGRFVARLAAAYARAEVARPSGRGWTTEPPSGWTPTHSVALRRALDETQRGRLLRYRTAA